MKSNRSAYKNVVFSMLGVVFNTIIPIIVFPYVTRVLGVDGIGKYSFYSSAFTYAALFTGFGIALYGAREIGKNADNTLYRSQIFTELLVFNLLTVAISTIFVMYFAFLSPYSADKAIILIFSLTLLTNAIGAEWFFVGIEMQGFMLVRNILIKTISTILIFVLVKHPDHLLRYVTITCFSLAGLSFTNVHYWIKLNDFKSVKALRLKKYVRPLSSVFSIEILLRFLGLGDVVLLGILAGDNAVGIYSMGLKVFLLMSSILKVTATTLMPRSAYYIEHNDNEGFVGLLRTTIRMLFFIGLPISALMFIYAEPITMILGGKEFENAIGLMRGLSFFLLLSVLINTYVFQALYPQNHVKIVIYSHLIGLFVSLLLNFILVPYLSYRGTLFAFAVSTVAIAIIICIYQREFVVNTFQIAEYKNYFLSTALASVAAWLCMSIQTDYSLILSVMMFGMIYLFTLYLFKDRQLLQIINMLHYKKQ